MGDTAGDSTLESNTNLKRQPKHIEDAQRALKRRCVPLARTKTGGQRALKRRGCKRASLGKQATNDG